MATDDLSNKLSTRIATRRTIVKTGAKLAYAAPLVAASMKLNSATARPVVSGPGCLLNWRLAGFGFNEPLLVDDRLDVYLNGVWIGSPYSTTLNFQACPGDQIRITATNIAASAFLGRIWLHNADTQQQSSVFFLSSSGFGFPGPVVFWDQTFTIPSQ